jgi:hypothetical protein
MRSVERRWRIVYGGLTSQRPRGNRSREGEHCYHVVNEIDSVSETETKSEWRGEMAVVSIAVELSMMKVPMTFEACRLAGLSNIQIHSESLNTPRSRQLSLAHAPCTVQWLRLPLHALVSLANM